MFSPRFLSLHIEQGKSHHHINPLHLEDSSEGYIDLSSWVVKIIIAFVPKTGKMKQKIVMKVAMHCQKCRSKAMEIAAATEGVISVGIEGKEQDHLVVTGNEVDTTCLVKRLRKKVGHTDIESVEEVKPKEVKKPEEKKPEEKKEPPKFEQHFHPHFVRFEIVDDPRPSSFWPFM